MTTNSNVLDGVTGVEGNITKQQRPEDIRLQIIVDLSKLLCSFTIQAIVELLSGQKGEALEAMQSALLGGVFKNKK